MTVYIYVWALSISKAVSEHQRITRSSLAAKNRSSLLPPLSPRKSLIKSMFSEHILKAVSKHQRTAWSSLVEKGSSLLQPLSIASRKIIDKIKIKILKGIIFDRTSWNKTWQVSTKPLTSFLRSLLCQGSISTRVIRPFR